ncbi:unnamed protein product [Miscanthus lutarioriparius]|uniref:Uncharacterized protein n=1 Tax=Miscanthus lutarioriparius TaxID=422564 RepID=A0A811RCI3_9POAL|nr:unnamed protein product [Miscanthus lutarioriparius]
MDLLFRWLLGSGYPLSPSLLVMAMARWPTAACSRRPTADLVRPSPDPVALWLDLTSPKTEGPLMEASSGAAHERGWRSAGKLVLGMLQCRQCLMRLREVHQRGLDGGDGGVGSCTGMGPVVPTAHGGGPAVLLSAFAWRHRAGFEPPLAGPNRAAKASCQVRGEALHLRLVILVPGASSSIGFVQ